MIPEYRAGHPLQNYLRVRGDLMGFLAHVARDCGDFARFRVLAFPYLLVNDPAIIREALVDRSETVIIKGGASAGLARLIGHGILTNRGDAWRQSRAGLQPLFHQAALKSYWPAMAARVDESLARWRAASAPVAIQRELLALSVRITCSTLFGYVPRFDESDEAAEAIGVLQREGMERFVAGGDLASWLPLPINRRIDRAKATLVRLAQSAVNAGCTQPVDEILSILFAGTESPVNTLCFALKLLEESPDVLSRLKELVLNAGPATRWESLEEFDLLSQVISEAMRLFPAGWAFERFAAQDVELGGERVQKGTRLMFSPYVLHRNPRYWRDPERFDPSRFSTSPHTADGVPKYGYLPFGAGPRSCIGSRLAWAQMRLILGAMVAQCEWKTVRTPGVAPLTAEGAFKIRLSRPLQLTLQFT